MLQGSKVGENLLGEKNLHQAKKYMVHNIKRTQVEMYKIYSLLNSS